MKKGVIILSAAISAGLFILINIFMIQAIYDEITLFRAASAALGIPVWLYYAGVPVLSISVFRGVYLDAAKRLRLLDGQG